MPKDIRMLTDTKPSYLSLYPVVEISRMLIQFEERATITVASLDQLEIGHDSPLSIHAPRILR